MPIRRAPGAAIPVIIPGRPRRLLAAGAVSPDGCTCASGRHYHVCFICMTVTDLSPTRVECCKQNSGNESCRTTSFSLGSHRRAATKSSRRHSCPSLRRRAALQPREAARRRTKRGSGLRSKLRHSVFRSSGPTARRPDGDELPHHPRPSRLSGRSCPAKWRNAIGANVANRRGRRLAPEGASECSTRRQDHSAGRGRCHGGKERPRWNRITSGARYGETKHNNARTTGGIALSQTIRAVTQALGRDQHDPPHRPTGDALYTGHQLDRHLVGGRRSFGTTRASQPRCPQ